MARDRTLPRPLATLRKSSGTPATAAVVTSAMVLIVVAAIGEVAAAGAASSLIFLISFALVHWAVILMRQRSGQKSLPVLPVLGLTLCLGLAVFQVFAVPAAASVVSVWLAMGAGLYFATLAPGARLADASAVAVDPDLATLRGKSPLTLVPIANPASAASLIQLAETVRTPGGRVLLLSVARSADDEAPAVGHDPIGDAERILRESLSRSLEQGLSVETLFTASDDVWREIGRVADLHNCETVVFGLPKLATSGVEARLDSLLRTLDSHAVILRASPGWQLPKRATILVPIGGRADQSYLRTRLLASLSRRGEVEIRYLRVVSPGTSDGDYRRAEKEVEGLARNEMTTRFETALIVADDPVEAVIAAGESVDLVIVGSERSRQGGTVLTPFGRSLVERSSLPVVLISSR